jgi:hypothetical protein
MSRIKHSTLVSAAGGLICMAVMMIIGERKSLSMLGTTQTLYTDGHRTAFNLSANVDVRVVFSARSYYPDNTRPPQWIESYIEFHNDRVVVENGTNSARLKPGTKYLLYSCDAWCGGIGDRINGILTLFYVAMTTNRVLLIDHPNPFPLTETLVSNRVNWNVPKESLPPAGKVYRSIDSFNFPYLMEPCELEKDNEGLQIHVNQWYGEKFIWNSICMKRYLMNKNATNVGPEDFRHMYRWGFWTLFRFNKNVLRRADELKLMAGLPLLDSDRPIDNNRTSQSPQRKGATTSNDTIHKEKHIDEYLEYAPYIGVHIRGERHTGEENHRKFLECAQGLQKQIMLEQHNQPPRPIFIADDSYPGRDDLPVKKVIQSWDPDSVRIANSDVFHTDQTRNARNATIGNLDAYAELVILLDSECLVRSRSGFSELPHRISVSNKLTFERCGMQFDLCSEGAIEGVIQTLQWNNKSSRGNLGGGGKNNWCSWVGNTSNAPSC